MKENKITQDFLSTAYDVLSGKTNVVLSFQEQLDDEISTMLENIYETLTLNEQDDFEALFDLHEEGEISDEELVEGLMDYATSSGRAKKKLERSKKKTAKMQGKRDAKASKIKAKRKVKSDLAGEKKKQADMKAKSRSKSKVRKTVKKIGSKIGAGLKKVFGKSK